MDELEGKTNNIIILQKKYKDKDYSTKKLVEDIGTSIQIISAVVNTHMNYNCFVNQYRIREAMTMLTDKRYLDLNIEDISDAVGFSNRQSFYIAFYRFYGMTPRDYKLQYLSAHPSLAKKESKKRGRKPKGE